MVITKLQVQSHCCFIYTFIDYFCHIILIILKKKKNIENFVMEEKDHTQAHDFRHWWALLSNLAKWSLNSECIHNINTVYCILHVAYTLISGWESHTFWLQAAKHCEFPHIVTFILKLGSISIYHNYLWCLHQKVHWNYLKIAIAMRKRFRSIYSVYSFVLSIS